MKRQQGKIKDYVDPQAVETVADFNLDPARALAAYRFTDLTSDLLARWLDSLAEVAGGRGAAHALAGFRGVGKSHTLATFAAIATSPELRRKVSDQHVAASAGRLGNNRFLVARVERGKAETLEAELAEALAGAFGDAHISPWLANDDVAAMLAVAVSRAGTSQQSQRLVLIVDTAFDRTGRVGRNDGEKLSQIAHIACGAGAFVALALDDDIAGASGANAALAANYRIDYLDPEQLFRVADIYVLKKSREARQALQELYAQLRETVPGFNWTEARFAALYPIHPLIADASAAVRLYRQDFAFLPFAAEAATRAASRPASSLVLVDELFDLVEADLRRAGELADAFAAYDQIASQISQNFPVMSRLEAKLLLKALWCMSLDGRGATASDLCAALLLADEDKTGASLRRVADTLEKFQTLAPANSLRVAADANAGGDARYRFQINAAAEFEDQLDEEIEVFAKDARQAGLLGAKIVELLGATLPRAHFADWMFGRHDDALVFPPDGFSTLAVEWRGSLRPGRCFFKRADERASGIASVYAEVAENLARAAHEQRQANDGDAQEVFEWRLEITSPAAQTSAESAATIAATAEQTAGEAGATLNVMWRPVAPNADEARSLRRLAALELSIELTSIDEATRSTAHAALRAQAENIWTRLYLKDATLAVDGERVEWSAQARSGELLLQRLGAILSIYFERLYPSHPSLGATLDSGKVAVLTGSFFGGANTTDRTVQQLAADFAVPLGLATRRADATALTVAPNDETLKHEWSAQVISQADAADGATVPITELAAQLARTPYGLTKETQHLIFAALVAQRRIELVTANGDRITRRTLERALMWSEVAGIARAAAIHLNADELTAWARAITNDQTLETIVDAAGRESVRNALRVWLESWRAANIFERFDRVPDTILTTRLWNTAAVVRRSFDQVTDAVEAVLSDDAPLEEGLQRVADSFGESFDKLSRVKAQHLSLAGFLTNLEEFEQASRYAEAAEPTGVAEIEELRRELLYCATDAHCLLNEAVRERFFHVWQAFHTSYSEHYAAMHEQANQASGEQARQQLDAILRSPEWREFEAIAEQPFVEQKYRRQADKLLRKSGAVNCSLPVRELLQTQPACACRLKLTTDENDQYATSSSSAADTATELLRIIEQGRAAYRRTLLLLAPYLSHHFAAVAEDNGDGSQKAERARALAEHLQAQTLPALLTFTDAQLIQSAVETMIAPPPVRVPLPSRGYGLLTRDELAARLKQWIEDVPRHPSLLVEVSDEGEASVV